MKLARKRFVFAMLVVLSATPAATYGEEPTSVAPRDFWAFLPLGHSKPPAVDLPGETLDEIDRFVLARLRGAGLSFAPLADPVALARRVSFDLIGLPPASEQIAAIAADPSPEAYARLVDSLLASPQYGVRWGKYWLDAAGYADSNGYFNADSDRPLAYRYRDYVVAALNADKPFDQFIREQLAGDELAGYRPSAPLTAEEIDLLAATHFLRNSPDGTGESDGNPDERLIDKYTVIEGTVQIMGASLFGLTLQCARCHDHKFEPVTQREYYQLQAVLFSAFNPDDWRKPNERVLETATPAELATWQASVDSIEGEIAAARREYADWTRANRVRGVALFFDDFEAENGRLAARWSSTAPGDDQPGGAPAVNVDLGEAPGAIVRDGTLNLIESGGAGNRWLSTRQAFDWTPNRQGESIQVTFDLVAERVAESQPAERIGYYVALHDYDDNGLLAGGNVLIDGNPQGGAPLHVDYPGADSRPAGSIGVEGYLAGRNYGIRITNAGEGSFRLRHLVEGLPEGPEVKLAAMDLPDGGFGFEFCCGRSFRVDNVLVESFASDLAPDPERQSDDPFSKELFHRGRQLTERIAGLKAKQPKRPGLLAAVTDVSSQIPAVYLLRRGQYRDRGEIVAPAGLAILSDGDERLDPAPFSKEHEGTGVRTAFANWLTRPGSRAAARLARVTVNRLWQHHFGKGLVESVENLGVTGAPPSNRELLDYLAAEFAAGEWRMKALHRRIVLSRTYRQSSVADAASRDSDPDNRLLGRFPLLRLDAEARRDAMLAASGELDDSLGGPYVPTERLATGEVVVPESATGHSRRSIYLQQRRTQVASVLEVFDAPTIVAACTRRERSTLPLQSLHALNSSFVRARAKAFAARVAREAGDERTARVSRAFWLAFGRPPGEEERAAALEFVAAQPAEYAGDAQADKRAWIDLCQLLLAGNAFLYVE